MLMAAPVTPFWPKDGQTSADTVTTLRWSAQEGSGPLAVWMDGVKLAELAEGTDSYTPFPLSYGKHEWKIVPDGESEALIPARTLTISDAPLCRLPEGAILLREGWTMRSSAIVGMNGAEISSPSYNHSDWLKTSIPATALSVLVRNGLYLNPYVGLNNMRIPDADEDFNTRHNLLQYSHIEGKNPWAAPYWFRREFTIPNERAGQRTFITFNEINYRAELWINGKKIAGIQDMAGMERRFSYDISEYVSDGSNCVALAVYGPDHSGHPSEPPLTPLAPPGRNMGADGNFARNYTKLDTIGWDWTPAVRDRDMGISEDVFLSFSQGARLDELHVSTELALPDTTRASVEASLELTNDEDEEENGILRVILTHPSGKTSSYELPYSLKAKETVGISLNGENCPILNVFRPALWWPVGMGGQPLYTLRITRLSDDGQSSSTQTRFGIRKVDSVIENDVRSFFINGKKVFIRGGNWVNDLTLNNSASRYRKDLEYARAAGLNMLRVWGPDGVPPDAFFDSADELGILIQQDFLNDFWGMDKNDPKYLPPEELFRAASEDIVKRLRNHPSLVIWCGGNEGINQRESIITDEILATHDARGGRFYLRASDQFGLIGGGPYHTIVPENYFTHPKLTGFNSEIGPSGVPVFESLVRFLGIPKAAWAKNRFPLDANWAYHDATDRNAQGDMRRFSHYDDLLRKSYGAPQNEGESGLREYAAKAQVLNYDVYRAAIEAMNAKMWHGSTGYSLWKYNSSWPSVVWQLIDWYQTPNAGFYAVRKANEPVHIQLNRDDYSISFINNGDMNMNGIRLSATLYDQCMARAWDRAQEVELKAESSARTGWSVPLGDKMQYLSLKLLDNYGNLVADNFYWISRNNDFRALSELPEPQLEIEQYCFCDNGKGSVTAIVRNKGKTLAFMLKMSLVDLENGEELPYGIWSDDYFSLLPGEEKRVEIQIESDCIPGELKVTARPILLHR